MCKRKRASERESEMETRKKGEKESESSIARGGAPLINVTLANRHTTHTLGAQHYTLMHVRYIHIYYICIPTMDYGELSAAVAATCNAQTIGIAKKYNTEWSSHKACSPVSTSSTSTKQPLPLPARRRPKVQLKGVSAGCTRRCAPEYGYVEYTICIDVCVL